MDVQGFMPAAGLAVLRELARGKRVLEIGTWKGRTALAMAETAVEVWTVDHFRGDKYAGKANTLRETWENIRQHPAGDDVILLAGPFQRVLPSLDLSQFDLLFYDADHDYEPTVTFLREVMVEARRDAVIAVDDYDPIRYPQVVKAVYDVVPDWKLRVEGALAILDNPK